MYILQNAHWFVLLIGALVFFHELGHFVVAKLCNVQVLRFSLGFGPKLIGFTYGETEYTLSLLPLGGYVKMAGEEAETEAGSPAPATAAADASGQAPVAKGDTVDGLANAPPTAPPTIDRSRTLASKPLWQRSLIVIAGPISNLLLAFFVYLSMFVGAHTFGDTRLGVVSQNEPAWLGGLRPGDRITAINGTAVTDWDALQDIVGAHPDEDLRVAYERDGHPFIAAVRAGQRLGTDPFGAPVTLGRIGVSLQYVLPSVAIVDETSPAARAGLHTGDVVLAVGDRAVDAWHELRTAIAALPAGAPIVLRARRGEEEIKVTLAPSAWPTPLGELDRISSADAAGAAGYTGLVAKEATVASVRDSSPAAQAGLRPGDRLLTVITLVPTPPANSGPGTAAASKAPAGSVVRRPVGVWSIDLPSLGLAKGTKVSLEVQRGVEVLTVVLSAEEHAYSDEFRQSHEVVDVGVVNDLDALGTYTRVAPVGLAEASYQAGKQVGADMSLIGRGIGKMVSGSVPLANMGGPIMLFVIAEKSAKRGWDSFGRAMAMTSVNLGLLNVLPIPVLDGGHLLFYGIEAVTGRPPSVRLREYAQMVGMGLLLLLMLVVFRNDITRYLLGGA